MAILLKAIIGGGFIGCLLWLSQTRFRSLVGILLFFPIISVPTFFFLGNNGDAEKMRETILWSFKAIPVWIAFALTLYWCSYHWKIFPSMAVSLLVWFIAAAILIRL